jgi:hypothetical protein
MLRAWLLPFVIVVALPLLVWAARRFERRQLERGLWNHAGPINPVARRPTDSEIAYGVQFPRIEHEPLSAGDGHRVADERFLPGESDPDPGADVSSAGDSDHFSGDVSGDR